MGLVLATSVWAAALATSGVAVADEWSPPPDLEGAAPIVAAPEAHPDGHPHDLAPRMPASARMAPPGDEDRTSTVGYVGMGMTLSGLAMTLGGLYVALDRAYAPDADPDETDVKIAMGVAGVGGLFMLAGGLMWEVGTEDEPVRMAVGPTSIRVGGSF